MAERNDVRAMRDFELRLAPSAHEVTQAARGLAGCGGWRVSKPDELRVGVLEAGAGDAALVDERVQVAESLGPCGVGARGPRDRGRGEWTTTSCRSKAG